MTVCKDILRRVNVCRKRTDLTVHIGIHRTNDACLERLAYSGRNSTAFRINLDVVQDLVNIRTVSYDGRLIDDASGTEVAVAVGRGRCHGIAVKVVAVL